MIAVDGVDEFTCSTSLSVWQSPVSGFVWVFEDASFRRGEFGFVRCVEFVNFCVSLQLTVAVVGVGDS
jgi:hypothetical protein